jgi:alpha/beta hydrolase family protein DUF915
LPVGFAIPVLVGVLIDRPLPGLWVGIATVLVLAIDPGGERPARAAWMTLPVLTLAATLIVGNAIGTAPWLVIGLGLALVVGLVVAFFASGARAASVAAVAVLGYVAGAAVPDGLFAARRALLELAIGAAFGLILSLATWPSRPARRRYGGVAVTLAALAVIGSTGLFLSASADTDASTGASAQRPPATSGAAPATVPATVVVLAAGYFSSLPNTETYDPLTQKPKDADKIESYFDPHGIDADHGGRGCQSPIDLTTALHEEGALLVPFSYEGVQVFGTGDRPSLTVQRYGVATPSTVLPESAALRLAGEVRGLHQVWPSAAIVVVGHSEGGLVAERFFTDIYNPTSYPNVKGIFSLDSPLNGVRDRGVTAAAVLLGGLARTPVAPALAKEYADAWRSSAAHDQAVIDRDTASDGVYVAVGTRQDAVYQIADVPSQGLESQLLLGENGATTPFDLVNPATPRALGWNLADWPALAKASHGCVMASPRVIQAIVERAAPPGSVFHSLGSTARAQPAARTSQADAESAITSESTPGTSNTARFPRAERRSW